MTDGIKIWAALAALLAIAVGVLLIDLVLFPGIALPAIVYAIPIILAASFLPPSLVAAIAVGAAILQGVDAWLENAPLWLFSLDVIGIAVFGYLSTMLSLRSRRETELTARAREAATEAHEQRVRLETILQQMPAGVVIAESPSGRLVFASARTGQIWRRVFRQDLTIDQYAELGLYHPDGRPYDREDVPLARSLLHGEVITGEEIRIIRGDGSWGVVRSNSAPIRDDEGRTVAAVVAFDDITEFKRVEQEREQLLTEVQRRAAELNATITSVADGLLVYSPAAEIVQMNDAAASCSTRPTARPDGYP